MKLPLVRQIRKHRPAAHLGSTQWQYHEGSCSNLNDIHRSAELFAWTTLGCGQPTELDGKWRCRLASNSPKYLHDQHCTVGLGRDQCHWRNRPSERTRPRDEAARTRLKKCHAHARGSAFFQTVSTEEKTKSAFPWRALSRAELVYCWFRRSRATRSCSPSRRPSAQAPLNSGSDERRPVAADTRRTLGLSDWPQEPTRWKRTTQNEVAVPPASVDVTDAPWQPCASVAASARSPSQPPDQACRRSRRQS